MKSPRSVWQQIDPHILSSDDKRKGGNSKETSFHCDNINFENKNFWQSIMFNRLKAAIFHSEFARSVTLMIGGTSASMALFILSSPILTRLYTPDEFGLLAIFLSLLSAFGAIGTLRYEHAIPVPESESKGISLVLLSFLIVLILTFMFAALIFTNADLLNDFFKTSLFSTYFCFVFSGLLVTGAYQVFNSWAVRAKTFAILAKSKIGMSITVVAIQLAGYQFGTAALIAGRIFGLLVGATMLLAAMITRTNGSLISQEFAPGKIIQTAKEFRKFPLYSTWGAVFNVVGTELPVLFLSAMFSGSIAGMFLLTNRVLNLPMSLVGQAVGRVFYSNAPAASRDGSLANSVIEIHKMLALFVAAPSWIVLIAGPELFALVFGIEWKTAGEFSQWMAPFLYINFVASPLSPLHMVLNRQFQGTVFHFTLFIVRVSGLFVGGLFGSALLSIALFFLGGAICWVGFLVWIFYITGASTQKLAIDTVGAVLRGFALALPVLAAKAFDVANLYLYLSIILSGCLILVHHMIVLTARKP